VRRVLLFILPFVLLACSAAPAPHGTAGQPHAGCADRFADAITSPRAAVHGAFACQDAHLQASAANAGVKTDEDIRVYAATDPVLTMHSACPVIHRTHDYLVGTELPGYPTVRVDITTDADGRVSSFHVVPKSTCESA